MRRTISHHPAGSWPVNRETATVTLAFDERHRRRMTMNDDRSAPFLLDLPRAVLLADGDGLALSDGGFVRVRAAKEGVIDVRGIDPVHTARLAWHIGNRHIPMQVLPDGVLRLRDDHVLAAMLEGLGAAVHRGWAPFSPEPGAYAATAAGAHQHHSHDAHS